MPPYHRNDFRTAIVCALQLEADAVETQITKFYRSQEFGKADGDLNTYTLGQLGGHDVVVVWMPSEGNNLAAGAVASLMSSFPRINLALLVGVCAGVPYYSKGDQNIEIMLGDVIISTDVIQYDHGRQYPDTFQRKETLSQAPLAVKSQIKQLSGKRLSKDIASDISTYLNKLAQESSEYAYPGASLDKLFQAGYIHKHHHIPTEYCTLCSEHQHSTDPICEQARKSSCQELLCNDQQLVARQRLTSAVAYPSPAIHFGRIASGNVVMRSGEYRESHAREEGVIAFEMEAAGIWSRMACIVIKGVCDYADSHKNKKFQDYAAAAAATCARAILENLPLISTGEQQSGRFREERGSSESRRNMPSSLLLKLHATEPDLDMKRLWQKKGDLLPQGFSWIVSDKRFLCWRDERSSQLLCVKGDPGKGKTMISLGMVNYLAANLRQAHTLTTLAYFFCQNTDDRRKTAVSVIKGLLWVLIERNTRLECHLQKRFGVKGDSMFEGPESFEELWEVLLQIIQDESCETTIIVIDAIDECDQPDQATLLQCIRAAIKESRHKVKWFITSRNSPDLERFLLQLERDQNRSSTSISLEAEQIKVSEAVNVFIDSRLDELSSVVPYQQKLKQSVGARLKAKAEGTFLWVSLVCDRLRNVPSWQTQATLEALPPGLVPFYDRMLDMIERSGDREVVLFCKKLLRTATIAYRPLDLLEIGRLVGLPDNLCKDTSHMQDLIARCGSFLFIGDQNTVHFVHQSAKEYLGDVCRSRLDSSPLHDEHLSIARACVGVMNDTLKWNIGGYSSFDHMPLRKVGQNSSESSERCDYSVDFWSEHIKQASSGHSLTAPMYEPIIEHFIRKKLLYWLEYLSFTNKLSVMSTTLNNLLALPVQSEELRDLISDAIRICKHSAHVAEVWPLQVYSSALLFDHHTSILQQDYKKSFLRWVNAVQTTTPERQKAQHRIVEGHAAQSNIVTLSPDGQFLVFDLAKTALKVCRADSGIGFATIQHASKIVSVAISRDSRLIATASEDTQVRVFDMANKNPPQVFGGHTSRVNAVAFSPWQNFLASTSDDGTIMLWDLVNSCSYGAPEYHGSRVQAVAFHPQGKVLASGSSDMMVRTWNIESDKALALSRHASEVLSVVFSKDGRFLVCGLANGYIVLQNSRLDVLKIIEPFGRTATFKASIDVSPDCRLVLSTCPDRTIKLWNIKTGLLHSSLGGHESKVTAASFFPDGKSIASACWDKTIRVWDIEHNVFDKGTTQDPIIVAAIAFSPNGKLIATARGTPEIMLWDAKSAAQLYRFTFDEAIWEVSFSDNGDLLRTNRGCFSLHHMRTYLGLNEMNTPAKVDVEGEWVLWEKQRVIWLPSEYAPATFATRGNEVALFCRSGRILIISLVPHVVEAMLQELHG